MGNIHTVGPNEALVISGGCFNGRAKRRIVGGWGWACVGVTEVQRISLEVMTLNPVCENVETAEGVPVTVTGVAQVKVMTDDELLTTACEQFLGKESREIQHTILQTLEGHQRAILGTLTVEAIYSDRDEFARLVREVAAPDVGKMGIEILSFTIKDVYDRVNYLNSLGRAQTANVKRDADIGVAEAERDAGIREAECQKLTMDTKYAADTKIANSKRHFELQKATFDTEVLSRKAEAELAYELQAVKEKQKIRSEEVQIEVIERRKMIEIEEKEILRKEKELDATIRKPAEAEAYKLEQLANGARKQTVEQARAEAETIKLIGGAEASNIEAIGKAEAEGMKLKAQAFKKYGDVAMLSLVLDSLPQVASHVSAPLSRIDEIVVFGGNDATPALGSEFVKLLGTVPPAVHALTGVDLSKCIAKIPGAVVTTPAAAHA